MAPTVFRPVGRIVGRGKIAGIFLPFSAELNGIYDVVNVMGEYQLRHVGKAAMPAEKFTGLDLEGLFNQRPLSCMTEQEMSLLKN